MESISDVDTDAAIGAILAQKEDDEEVVEEAKATAAAKAKTEAKVKAAAKARAAKKAATKAAKASAQAAALSLFQEEGPPPEATGIESSNPAAAGLAPPPQVQQQQQPAVTLSSIGTGQPSMGGGAGQLVSWQPPSNVGAYGSFGSGEGSAGLFHHGGLNFFNSDSPFAVPMGDTPIAPGSARAVAAAPTGTPLPAESDLAARPAELPPPSARSIAAKQVKAKKLSESASRSCSALSVS